MHRLDPKSTVVGLALLAMGVVAVMSMGFTVHRALLDSRISEVGPCFQEFPDLAANFWRGELSIPAELAATRHYSDAFPWHDRWYLPFGPLTVVLFMPFVPFMADPFPTTAVTFALLVAAGWLMFTLARQHGFSDRNAAWVAAAYALGSALTPLVIPLFTSWTPLLVANVFLLTALYAQQTKRSPWLVGIMLALATATRPLSALGVLLFVLWSERKTQTGKPTRLLAFLVPIAVATLLICAYNFARFGDPLQTGYAHQWQYNPALIERMTHGASDLRYIPTNLWYFLAAPPYLSARFPFVIPDPMGMGILFSCPYLIFFLIYARPMRRLLAPLGAAAAGLLPALSYYASGYSQIGYRYAVDVYPLIFLAFVLALRGRLPRPAKALIAFSVVAHLCWMVAYFT